MPQGYRQGTGQPAWRGQTAVCLAFAAHPAFELDLFAALTPVLARVTVSPAFPNTEQRPQAFPGREMNTWGVVQRRAKAKRREKPNFMAGFLLFVSTGFGKGEFWERGRESGMGKNP